MRILKLKRLMVNRNIPDLLQPSQQSSGIFSNASLDLPFAQRKVLTDAISGKNLISFTRTSSGTYAGSDGVLQRATTNLLVQSNQFDTTWTNTNSTETATSGTAPDGTNTAWQLRDTVDASAVVHSLNQTVTFTAATAYTFSVWGKAGTLDRMALVFPATLFTNATARSCSVSFSTGVVSTGGSPTSASAVQFPNGWWRVSVTATVDNGVAAAVSIRTSTAGGSTYQGDGNGTILVWGAQLEQSSTVGEYIPTTSTINSAPRFDHNPTTGESLGLLVEEQRTNSIRNNTMVGAVAGTPGTAPTNWTITSSATGLTREIVGTGIESGITYIDVRYSGTSTSAGSLQFSPDTTTGVPALTGQTWTGSSYVRLVGGSLPGAAAWVWLERDSGGTIVVSGSGGSVSVTQDALNSQRRTTTRTLSGGATVANLSLRIDVTVPNTTAVDVTLRIGLPQLEQGAFATSVISTTGTAATRNADVASITGTNFSSWYRQDEGSVYWEGTRNRTTGFPERFSLNDGTVNNRIFSYFDAAGNSSTFTVVTSSVNQGDIFGGGGALNSNLRTGFGFALNNVSAIYSGGVQNTDTTVTLPIVDRLVIGNGLGGTIRRLTYWPARLANSTLQQITS